MCWHRIFGRFCGSFGGMDLGGHVLREQLVLCGVIFPIVFQRLLVTLLVLVIVVGGFGAIN